MKLRNSFLIACLAGLLPLAAASAQTNGSNSSYSQYGMGLTGDQSQGFNRSMGGVAQGLRAGNRVNMLNPASYSATDSLTFLFDVGMSLQRTRLSQGSTHQTANNTAFDYVNAAFRLRRGLGMSVGFVPYSSIGYSFSREDPFLPSDQLSQAVTQTLTYNGDGGLHQCYVGVGWEAFKGFSVGANVSYLWGSITNTMVQSFSENGTANTSNYSSQTTKYSADLKTWRGDIGVQYEQALDAKNLLSVGATVGIGHRIGSDATMLRYSASGDTIQRTTSRAYELPMTYSVGAAWKHDDKLTLAADFTYEAWGRCVTPRVHNGGTDASATTYTPTTGTYTDRFRINAGAEYVPARYDRSYLMRINYRLGAYYTSPNLKVGGLDGPREYGITAGLGLPIINKYNSRSVVNVGVQWARRDPSASTLITENILRINIGITFNEAWFMKWKFQ